MDLGSVAGLKFATTVEKPLPFFVNVSGRFKMNDNQIHRNRPQIGEGLKKDVTMKKKEKKKKSDFIHANIFIKRDILIGASNNEIVLLLLK